MGSLLTKVFLIAVSLQLPMVQTLHAAESPVVKDASTETENPYYPKYPQVTINHPEKGELIKRGEYLTKMGDCIACHTNEPSKGPVFAGGLPLNTPFGTFYSPNITPDKETGIGSWTEEDFIRAMKEGRDPHGRNYFPVFPYVYFSKVTDEDLRAMYAYFMSIPPVHLPNKSLPFPFSVPGARLSLWGWNFLFFFPNNEPFVERKDKSPEWNRGRYLVDGLGHCSMCHTPLNPLGSPKQRYYLTGGFIDGYWAPNITQKGLENASDKEVAEVFSKGHLIHKAGPVAGPMAEVNYNSLRHLTEEDGLAIAHYLKSVVSEEPMGLPPSENPPSLARGKEVYWTACTVCHDNGEMSAPILGDGPNWFMRLKSSGLTGLHNRAIKGFNSMPYKGGCVTCSENDIISAVNYILNESLSRSQWLDLKSGGKEKFPTSGKDIYNENCSVCHNEGKSGAPKIGDKAVWDSLLNKNLDVLLENTLHGKNHPKEGGCKQCTTKEVKEAIKYIANESKAAGNYTLW